MIKILNCNKTIISKYFQNIAIVHHTQIKCQNMKEIKLLRLPKWKNGECKGTTIKYSQICNSKEIYENQIRNTVKLIIICN